MKHKQLNTGIVVTYKKNGNIDKLVSIFDNDVTSKPLGNSEGFKTHSSYIPFIRDKFKQWYNKHF